MSDTSRELEAVVVKEAMARVRVAELERELAEARIEIGKANVHTAHWQACCSEDTTAQLTAHKAALNLCQMALNADNHETYLELKAEALSEIAKLKGTK